MKNKKLSDNTEKLFSDIHKMNIYNSKNPFETYSISNDMESSFFDTSKPLDGSKLNNSDRELIQNHLEKYLPSDSLRLEIQIQRITKHLETSQREMDCLNLLANSTSINLQKRSIQEKIDLLSTQLDSYKEQYKKISYVHKVAMNLRERFKNNIDIVTAIKKSIYGKDADYLQTFMNANNSINLLSSKLENLQNLQSKSDAESTIVDIVCNYNKIISNAEKNKKDYVESHSKNIFKFLRSKFQKLYYGYEIPDKY